MRAPGRRSPQENKRRASRQGGNMDDILNRFFYPKAIAIIGASTDPMKLGGRPIDQTLRLGFEGKIYPVNPGSPEVQGLKAFAAVSDLPDDTDCAIIVVPARGVEEAVAACAQKKIPLAVILSSGFAEAGEKGRVAQARIVETAAKAGMRLVGPNSMGGLSLESRFSATFTGICEHTGKDWPALGSVSIASQSGFIGSHLMGLLRDRGVGIAKWIATGNQADIDVSDCVAHLARDSISDIIAVYIEGTTRPQALREAFREARKRGKIVVALKAGRTDEGAAAVASHTASMVGGYDVYEAIFKQDGVHCAASIEEMTDMIAALSTGRRIPGNKLAVGTVSGGLGILSADEAAEHGFVLPTLVDDLQTHIREGNPLATTRNPVDMGSLVNYDRVVDALGVRADFDSVAFIIGHFGLLEHNMGALLQWLTDARAKQPDRFYCLVACLSDAWRLKFQEIGVFVCEELTRAIATMAAIRDMSAKAAQAATDLPKLAPIPHDSGIFAGGERAAKQLVEQMGIAVVKDALAATAQDAVAAARTFGGKVVLKVASADIAHKSDVGGVMLGLEGDEAVASAFEKIMANAHKAMPQAKIDGVLVSPMISGGVETIVGMKRDPVFGPAILFGLGGIFVEIFHDTSLRVAPFSVATAHEMIRAIKSYPLLAGARGRPVADIDALAEALSRLSVFAAEQGGAYGSIEINPLIVLPKGRGVMAVDALVTPIEPG
jgi:acyl-CoA synthetase (NDP forming)